MSKNNNKTALNILENLHALTHTLHDISSNKEGRGTRKKQAELTKSQMIDNLNELTELLHLAE